MTKKRKTTNGRKTVPCETCGDAIEMTNGEDYRFCSRGCYYAYARVVGTPQQSNDPTPDEIAAWCLKIQAEWTDEMRMDRVRADWKPVLVRALVERRVLV